MASNATRKTGWLAQALAAVKHFDCGSVRPLFKPGALLYAAMQPSSPGIGETGIEGQ
ncbi:hypothetical protein [Mesorhizobium montanum]|uniref:hypothetical protein n=1 Tax=Mesorhizobium montanum TaxID=3072323 RepID=UPI002A23AF89|nr:hypothetical protein [Mesorhizobium sp. MSK_1335]